MPAPSSQSVPTPLREIAKVVRSKNAGPFEITLDIIFKNRADFDAVKITLPRPRAQGAIGETDMHAAQQHVPLQEIRVPWPAP